MRRTLTCVAVLLAVLGAGTASWAVAPAKAYYWKAFGGGMRKPATINETIQVPDGQSPYLLVVRNSFGWQDGEYEASGLTLTLNGQQLIGGGQFTSKTALAERSVSNGGEWRLNMIIGGSRDSFIIVEVYLQESGHAEAYKHLNRLWSSSGAVPEMHLPHGASMSAYWDGIENPRDVDITYDKTPGAFSYDIYRAESPSGPWKLVRTQLTSSFERSWAGPEGSAQFVDHFRDMDGAPLSYLTLYYKVVAHSQQGGVLATYPVLTLPPWEPATDMPAHPQPNYRGPSGAGQARPEASGEGGEVNGVRLASLH